MTGFIQALVDQGIRSGRQGSGTPWCWRRGPGYRLGPHQAGVRGIHIGVRSPQKVQPLVDAFGAYGSLDACHWESESFKQRLGSADLIIKIRPLGNDLAGRHGTG